MATGGAPRHLEARNLWMFRAAALAIAIAIWLFASYLPRLEEVSEPRVSSEVVATIDFETSEDYLILNRSSVQMITVRVRGRAERVRGLSSQDVRVQVPFPSNFTPNEPTEIALSANNVRLPRDLEVESLKPDRITLLIDEKETKFVKVRPTFAGEPAARATINRELTRVDPPQVLVEGPLRTLEKLDDIATARINLAGRALSFDQQVGLQPDDEATRVLRPTLVTVYVALDVPVPNGPPTGGSR